MNLHLIFWLKTAETSPKEGPKEGRKECGVGEKKLLAVLKDLDFRWVVWVVVLLDV